MVLKRLIPCLLLKNRRLVKTVNFTNPSYIGDPINALKIFNDKKVDELVLLDIEVSKKQLSIDFELIEDFANECFMPFTYGGGVKTLDDFKRLFSLGVEKVAVNTLMLSSPEVCKLAIKSFGSQSVVVSIDVVRKENDYLVFSHTNQTTSISLKEYLLKIKELGFGEVFLTSVDREGTWLGFDVELVKFVKENIEIPLVVNGGCGSKEDIKKIVNHASGVAIGSMAVYQKKGKGVLIRFPQREELLIDEYPF